MKNFSLTLGLCLIPLVLFGCGQGKSNKNTTPPPSTSTASSMSSSLSVSSSSSVSSPRSYSVGLPQLHINTVGAAPITSKEIYVAGNFELKTAEDNPIQGDLDIRGRGNSTWDWAKKPYRLQLKQATSLLGMSSSKHWVLLANFADKTLLRSDLAFTFSRAMDFEYTVADRHIHLFMNGQYEGVYQLVEQIRIAKNRVNLPEIKPLDTDPSLISGGYLMEVDFRMATNLCNDPQTAIYFPMCINGVNTERLKTYCYDSTHGMDPICLKDPDLMAPERDAQRAYIQNYFTQLEAALYSDSFADSATGYSTYFDVDSIINYYLINEFFKNVDAGVASFYMYKKRDGKLFFGPVWDFDFALGNVSYSTVHLTDGWHLRNTPWFQRLFQDPAFSLKVKNRWNELKTKGVFEQFFKHIIDQSTALEAMQKVNFERWDQLDGVPFFQWRSWFNASLPMPGTYKGEVEKLTTWSQQRFQWMDAQFNSN